MEKDMGNIKYNSKVVLGQTYKHKYSSIKGTAMSVTFYLQGCARIALLPKESKDNTWFNFDELELELEGIEAPDNTGGPRPDMPNKN